MERFLIVKTSSLGDILQVLPVLVFLKRRFPTCQIDWVVESVYEELLHAHPLIDRTISFPLRYWKKQGLLASLFKEGGRFTKNLRQSFYDCIFDLQGNCKSGVITALARGRQKVGFGWSSVSEWPNLLATRFHYNVPSSQNVREGYLQLVQTHFHASQKSSRFQEHLFSLTSSEREGLENLSLPFSSKRVMICPGAFWPNKQLPEPLFAQFLHLLWERDHSFFVYVWGSEQEREQALRLAHPFSSSSLVLPARLSIPQWQHLMKRMDLVIAFDSSSLHLCGTVNVPSFSFFGPTLASAYKPVGSRHGSFQCPCPKGVMFTKRCPFLRTCASGTCYHNLLIEKVFQQFVLWEESIYSFSALEN